MENKMTGIMISDFAVIGGINAEKNGILSNKKDSKLAVFEATNEMYKLLLDIGNVGNKIYCNATSDTSLINIKSMLKKGTISLKDMNGQSLKLEGKDIVYKDSKEKVKTRSFGEDEEIQMMDLEIVPNLEKLKEEQLKIEELLGKIRENIKMKGTEKEEGLDNMRNKFRQI
jgi:hypothetical protein